MELKYVFYSFIFLIGIMGTISFLFAETNFQTAIATLLTIIAALILGIFIILSIELEHKSEQEAD